MSASEKATTPLPAVIRTPDSVYAKAAELRERFADVDDEPRQARIVMDRWTYENFMNSHKSRFDLNIKNGRPTWAGLEVQCIAYQPSVELLSHHGVMEKHAVISMHDDPFLMSIQYTKGRNSRIVYLDDPEIHPFWL